MKNPFPKFTVSPKWLIPVPVALVLLAYPFLASAPTATPAPSPEVLGSETVSPLGLPQDQDKATPPRLEGQLSLDSIKAKSFLAYDVNSGSMLAEKESTQPVAIASITKLMTALVVYKNTPSFKTNILITGKDLFAIEPVLGVKTGDQITANDLFYAMLVGSANDAALTLANHVEIETGKSFIEMMNATAQELGMANSHFSNPLGFDSEANYSTANDLKILIQAIKQYQAFSLVGRNQGYSFTSLNGTQYSVKTTNKLIQGNKELYAIKTGYTDLAQGAMITEIRGTGHSFIVIVLDSPNREDDTLALKSEIEKKYVWP